MKQIFSFCLLVLFCRMAAGLTVELGEAFQLADDVAGIMFGNSSTYSVGFHPAQGGVVFFTAASIDGRIVGAHSMKTNRTFIVLGNTTSKKSCENVWNPVTQKFEASPDASTYPWLPPTSKIALPSSLDVVSENEVLFADGMPSSHVLWIRAEKLIDELANESYTGAAQPYPSLSAQYVLIAVGTFCNFTQHVMTPGSNAAVAIGPPDFVKYRKKTQQLFVSQREVIAVVANNVTSVFFGQLQKKAQTDADRTANSVPILRQNALSGGIGQLALTDDEDFLFFPEADLHSVRVINLNTNMASIAAGPPDLIGYFPPPVCTRTKPCDVHNISMVLPRLLVLFKNTTSNELSAFVVDVTWGIIYRIFFAQNLAYVAYGIPPAYQPSTRQFHALAAPVGTTDLGAPRQIALSFDALLIATSRGIWKLPLNVTPPLVPTPSPRIVNSTCNVFDFCHGNAFESYGFPASIGCFCRCKPLWNGSTCDKRVDGYVRTKSATATHTKSALGTHTKTLLTSVSHSVPVEKFPVPEPIDPVVKEVAIVSVTTTTVVMSVITNPTIATQASRSELLLRISACEVDLDQQLPWTSNVLRIHIGNSPLRYHLGAVLGNIAAAVGVIAGHFLVVLVYHKCFQSTSLPASSSTTSMVAAASLLKAKAALRFPSVASFILFLLIEGTVRSAVVLLRHGNSDVSFRMAGAFGVLVCLIPFVVFITYFKTDFKAEYVPLLPSTAAEEETESGPNHSQNPIARMWRSMRARWRKLMNIEGKWRDDNFFQTKRFGGIFKDYKPNAYAFSLAELTMSFFAGVIDGAKAPDDNCLWIVIALTYVFICFFFALVYYKPAIQPFTRYVLLIVSFLQMAAAIILVLAALFKSTTLMSWSNNTAASSMFVMAIISFAELFHRFFYVIKFCLSRCSKKNRRELANFSLLSQANGSLAIPMLESRGEPHRPLPVQHAQELAWSFEQSEANQSRLASSQPTNNSAVLSPVDNIAQSAFEGFSFDNTNTEAAAAATAARNNEDTSPLAPHGPRELMAHEILRQELEGMLNSDAMEHGKRSAAQVHQVPSIIVDAPPVTLDNVLEDIQRMSNSSQRTSTTVSFASRRSFQKDNSSSSRATTTSSGGMGSAVHSTESFGNSFPRRRK